MDSEVAKHIEALKDADWEVRYSVVAALAVLGDACAVPALAEALNDENDRVRLCAAKALGEAGKVAVPALVGALKDANSSVRSHVVFSLGQIGDAAAVPALAEALNDADDKVCLFAAYALGEVGDASAVPALIKALGGANISGRIAAAEALGRIREAAAVPALIAALKNNESYVCERVAKAFLLLGGATSLPRKVLSSSRLSPQEKL